MKQLIIGLVISCFLLSCSESKPFKFEKDGIKFTCPKGWEISEQEKVDKNGYYLAVEKNGLNSSGIIAITWINDSLDLEYWLKASESEFKAEPVYKNSDLAFEGIVRNKFSKNNSMSVNFHVSVLGVEHRGVLHTFHSQGKTIHILKQEAVEDIESNKEGFDRIEQSFSND